MPVPLFKIEVVKLALGLKQKIFASCLMLSGLLGLFWSDRATLVNAKRAGEPSNNPTRTAESGGVQRQLRDGPALREFTAKLPLSFEQNLGQLESRAKFLARGPGYNLFLTSTGALLELRKSSKTRSHSSRKPGSAGILPANASIARERSDKLSALPAKVVQSQAKASRALLGFSLRGANASAVAKGIDTLPGKRNYFIGNDPARWHTGVPTFRAVCYEGIYPGITLTYYGNQQQLEYDFSIAPGADPHAIRMTFISGVRPRISAEGDLVLQTPAGEIRQRKPVVYQEINGQRQLIDGRFVLLVGRKQGLQLAGTTRPNRWSSIRRSFTQPTWVPVVTIWAAALP